MTDNKLREAVAWRAKLKGNTGWVYYDFKPPSVFDTMTGATTRLTDIQPLYVHPEDAPGGPTENTMAALDETINLVLQWMGHPALEVAGFKEGRIPVDVRQAWRNDFRLALIALNRLKGDET